MSSLCASCGLELPNGTELCAHHHMIFGDDWAAANRTMCNFFHRQQVPPRLTEVQRNDDFWAGAE